MLKVLEALIAMTTVAVTFILVYRGMDVPDMETVNWRNYGFDALQSLDDTGVLAGYAINGDNAGLNSSLAPLLPAGVEYRTVICAAPCSEPNINATKVTSVNYYTAGNITNFAPRRTLLYMWSQ